MNVMKVLKIEWKSEFKPNEIQCSVYDCINPLELEIHEIFTHLEIMHLILFSFTTMKNCNVNQLSSAFDQNLNHNFE